MPAKKRKVDMGKVKRGLGIVMPSEMERDVEVDYRPLLRVLLVGGDPQQRDALAALVSWALTACLGNRGIDIGFLDGPKTAREALDALEGYRVTIRDGGS